MFLWEGKIGVQNLLLQCFAQRTTDRMRNVAETPIRHAAGRHRKKQAVVPGDDFDIVYRQYAVKRDGNQRFELAGRFDMADLMSVISME